MNLDIKITIKLVKTGGKRTDTNKNMKAEKRILRLIKLCQRPFLIIL